MHDKLMAIDIVSKFEDWGVDLEKEEGMEEVSRICLRV